MYQRGEQRPQRRSELNRKTDLLLLSLAAGRRGTSLLSRAPGVPASRRRLLTRAPAARPACRLLRVRKCARGAKTRTRTNTKDGWWASAFFGALPAVSAHARRFIPLQTWRPQEGGRSLGGGASPGQTGKLTNAFISFLSVLIVATM